jgi:hypothetical protein
VFRTCRPTGTCTPSNAHLAWPLFEEGRLVDNQCQDTAVSDTVTPSAFQKVRTHQKKRHGALYIAENKIQRASTPVHPSLLLPRMHAMRRRKAPDYTRFWLSCIDSAHAPCRDIRTRRMQEQVHSLNSAIQ